jgi:hypothetical protein
MAQKKQPAKKTVTKKSAAPAKAATKAATKAPAKAKGGWSETMKQALANKRPAGGFPDQPKPRDSGVQKVKKNAF